MVAVTTYEVRLELTGWDVIWALKNRLVFLTKAVRTVYAEPNARRPPGFRMPGTSIPGIVQAGTYVWRGEREFWCIHYTGNSVVFELENAPYKRIVVDVREPERVMQRVRAAMAAQP